MKFCLWQVVMTHGAAESIKESERRIVIARHSSGDWGEVCKEDKRENDLAVKKGGRIFSAYWTAKREKVWVITEADRSSTTLLMPDEY